MLNERQTNKWAKVIQERQRYFDQSNIKYYLQIIPDKHPVYSQFLPDDCILAKTRNIDLFLESVSPILLHRMNYPLDIIITGSAQHQVYFKWDSHWTDRGAYLAYLDLMKMIKHDYPELSILKSPTFKPGKFQGDLARMAEIDIEEPTDFFNQTTSIDISFDNKVKNTGRIISFANPAAKNNLTIMVFGSSSSLFTLKFLNQDFTKVIFYWSGNFDYSAIEHYKPDLIINQIRERHLIRPADDLVGLNTTEMAFVKSFLDIGEAISPIPFNTKSILENCFAKVGNKSNQAYKKYLKTLAEKLKLENIYDYSIKIDRNRFSYRTIHFMVKTRTLANQIYAGTLISRLNKIARSK